MDDDAKDGEWFRVRAAETTIGRAGADILVPHDEQVSGVHAQLSRRFHDNRYEWFLRDLQSTNGTFLKVSKARLQNNQEMLLGGHRYRFALSVSEAESTQEELTQGTRGWRTVPQIDPKTILPMLERLTSSEHSVMLSCPHTDVSLGSDPSRAMLVIADDPMISPIHAKIWRDRAGQWLIQDENSLNGVWVAITEKRLETDAAIQIGEQRLIIKMP